VTRADQIDQRLQGLLGDETDVALVAVGGYGRRELCPKSDIDVLLVHRGRKDIAEVAERIWYPLWDDGLKLGHGVRTVKEALALAGSELEVATSLLDGRFVAGDPGLADELCRRASDQWRKGSGRWLAALDRSVADRHAAAGEVAFLLEPDLKERRGGLRDVQAMRWAEAARRVLLPGDDDTLQEAYDLLLRVRCALHDVTGKANDRLALQDQDAVAAAVGARDADALMAEVAAAARTIAWTSDETWWRVRATLAGPSGRVVTRDREVGAGLLLRDGVVELALDAEVAGDPTIALRAGAAAAANATRLSRAALDRLAAEAPGPGDPWPDAAREALVELLATGRDAIPVLEALDQRGLLVRMLPEWEPVRSRPQRNAYHRFTIDRHLCEAAAEAARLVDRVERPDLLLIGALLHDIGKGRPGDHTEVGVEIVKTVGRRLGFGADDVDVLVGMVQHHLLLPDTATRRDLDDPHTAAAVAAAVGTAQSLDLLHALTEADSIATGPAAWGSWKATLVSQLVDRVHRALTGDGTLAEEDDGGAAVALADLAERAKAAGDLVVEASDGTVALAGRDRPGLFARVAGTLALHGLDVLSARVASTDDGIAVESFDVTAPFGPPDWTAVEADLRRALAGRLSIEARLAKRAAAYRRSRPPAGALAATPVRISVAFDNGASAVATVVDVRAPNGIGRLYRITRALADMDLDVRHAKVSTLGPEVVDAFYVVDAAGAKVTDAAYQAEIEACILAELGRGHPAAVGGT